MPYLKFQFHIGSIQGCCCCKLKRKIRCVSIPHWFDSRERRFSVSLLHTTVSIPHWFDSRCAALWAHRLYVISFNSTLVRFKVAAAVVTCVPHYRFNSTLVRFKVVISSVDSRGVSCFNSTLVRFKGVRLRTAGQALVVFQFHIGSIQGSSNTHCGMSDNSVSIPHWFDSRVIHRYL